MMHFLIICSCKLPQTTAFGWWQTEAFFLFFKKKKKKRLLSFHFNKFTQWNTAEMLNNRKLWHPFFSRACFESVNLSTNSTAYPQTGFSYRKQCAVTPNSWAHMKAILLFNAKSVHLRSYTLQLSVKSKELGSTLLFVCIEFNIVYIWITSIRLVGWVALWFIHLINEAILNYCTTANCTHIIIFFKWQCSHFRTYL